LQPRESRVPACGGHGFCVSATGRPQPSQGSRRLSDLIGYTGTTASKGRSGSLQTRTCCQPVGRTRRPALRRLRSSLSSKLRKIGRRRRRLRFLLAAKWCLDPYRGSQRLPQRRGVPIYEPTTPVGTNDTNEKNLDLRSTEIRSKDPSVTGSFGQSFNRIRR
jgi:hypothetical protein